MKSIGYFILCLASAHAAQAMEHTTTHTQEYSHTLKDLVTKLVAINVITVQDKPTNVEVLESASPNGLVVALVARKDVEQQERQFTESEFTPFYINQTPECIEIRPHVAGTYTVHLPGKTPFSVSNAQGTINVHPAVAPFQMHKN